MTLYDIDLPDEDEQDEEEREDEQKREPDLPPGPMLIESR